MSTIKSDTSNDVTAFSTSPENWEFHKVKSKITPFPVNSDGGSNNGTSENHNDIDQLKREVNELSYNYNKMKIKYDKEKHVNFILTNLLHQHHILLPKDASSSINESDGYEDCEKKSGSQYDPPPIGLYPDNNNENVFNSFNYIKELTKKRNIVIRYRHINYWTMTTSRKIKTVWSAFKSLFCLNGPRFRFDILKDIDGVISPRKMTLILGPPGCGKSTFLKAISGRLHSSNCHLTGNITYNRSSPSSKHFLVSKVVDYVEQDDRHAPTLTVLETLEFAWRTSTGGHHSFAVAKDERSAEILDHEDPLLSKVRNIITLLGLNSCIHTIVGDDMIRGVSGGQKRRVTAGEFFVTPARIKCLDSISSGLDSATTFDIIKVLRYATECFGYTPVVSLLQPAPEVYELFDDIILMSMGQVLYHGPRRKILPYFQSLGYQCPNHVDVADFLEELPTHDGLHFIKHGFKRGAVPRGTEALVQAWKSSDLYASMMADFDSDEVDDENGWQTCDIRPYPSTMWYHCKLLLQRQIIRIRRNTQFIRSRIVQILFVGGVMASLFTNLAITDYHSMMGFIFFASLFLSLANFSLIPEIIQDKIVFYKHAKASFYPASAFVMAQAIVMYPLNILEAVLLASIVYWAVGLSSDDYGGRFFIFTAFIFLFSVTVSQLYRTVAYMCASIDVVQPVCGIIIVLMVLFSGYICPKDNIPDGWLWAYWINPISWTIQSLLINEFSSTKYNFYLTSKSTTFFGISVLKAAGFESEYIWVWYGLIMMCLQYVLLLGLTTLLLQFYHPEVTRAGNSNIPEAEDLNVEDELPSELMDKNLITEIDSNIMLEKKEEARKRRVSLRETELPFDRVAFAFKDLWYSVLLSNGDELELLKGVDGYFLPGTMTALMGSSGAGKTTLLDVIAGRKNSGVVKGHVLVNGKPKEENRFRQLMGYVEQFDSLYPRDTVLEAIQFSAALRLGGEGSTVTTASRSKWVQHVIEMLELKSIENNVIGSEESGGLSFAQKKRVSIAVELAANPSILFLDEPTSGLDARAAQVLIRVIKRLTTSGRTVICTIHQPSSYIFNNFDSLLLLRRGGQTVYFGPIGNSSINLINYFESIPGVMPILPSQNPASWMLDQIGAGTTTTSSSTVDMHQYYLRSDLGKKNRVTLDQMGNFHEQSKDFLEGSGIRFRLRRKRHHKYHATSWTQLKYLTVRAVGSYWRNPSYNFSRMVVSIIIALIFGSVYSRQKYTTGTNCIARVSVSYCCVMFCGIVGQITVAPVVASERPAFYREQQCRMYRIIWHEIAALVVEVPYLAVCSLLFTLPFFFIVGFDKGNIAVKFFWYWLLQGLYMSCLVYQGHFLVAALPSLPVVSVLAGLMSVLNSLFAGFYISSQNIPNFWKFMYWLSPLHYALEGLIFTQSHGDHTIITTFTGEKVYAQDFYPTVYQEWGYHNRFFDVLAMLIYIAVLRIGTYLSRKYLRHQVK